MVGGQAVLEGVMMRGDGKVATAVRVADGHIETEVRDVNSIADRFPILKKPFLRGVVALKNGDVIDVSIGNHPDDPQFVITDLLPHLAADQMNKTAGKVIEGESLNLLIGSTFDPASPYAGSFVLVRLNFYVGARKSEIPS